MFLHLIAFLNVFKVKELLQIKSMAIKMLPHKDISFITLLESDPGSYLCRFIQMFFAFLEGKYVSIRSDSIRIYDCHFNANLFTLRLLLTL